MRRLMVSALVAVMAAIIGPRLVGPTNRSAGAPFVYEPPEGFVPANDVKGAEAEGAKVWMHESAERKRFDGSIEDRRSVSARIILNHTNKEMSVEEADLAQLSSEMPKAFEGMCTWVHRRHELRVRADGARVGLIEGDCNREVDLGAFGLPSQPLKQRKLQLMFPDDAGTTIITASYPTDEASRWEPLLEATIAKAKGVATRVPSPAPWAYGAWAIAGAVLGWLASALIFRNESAPPVTAPQAKRRADRAASERADEDENDDENEEDA